MRRNGLPTLPSVPKALGDHQDRIRKLEFRKAGSGWQFDIDNEGGWGYVIANDSTDIDFGDLGMVIGDRTGQGTFVFSQDGDSGDISAITLTPDAIVISVGEALSVILDRTTGTLTAYDSSGNPMLQMTDGSPDLHLPTGGNVVFDL